MQWKLTYSGDNKELSLNGFLERVAELMRARNVTKEQVFDSALDLFSGRALVWYRAVRKSLSGWDELVIALREEFQHPDYDEHLFDEIRRRTQGPNESISIYISIMSNLFSRLSIKIPECNQLRIIMKNLTPFYQGQLGLVDIKSLEDLRSMGRRLELRKSYVDAYVPPPRRMQSLEPDLACMSNSTASCGRLDEVESSQSRPEVVASGNAAVRKCWNCGGTDHLANRCLRALRRHCFGCGRPGVIRSECLNCRRNPGNGPLRRQ